jgi:hypothetical protein
MGTGSFKSDIPQEVVINIDLKVIADKLASNPDFIEAIAKAVRNQITKDVRTMGNSFGVWAQKQPTPIVNAPKATKRLN